MHPIDNYVRFILPHSTNAPKGNYLIPFEQVASNPRGYLLGTDGIMCTQNLIDSKESQYVANGWNKASYQKAAKIWLGMEVTDCQGEADGYSIREMGLKIATNAKGNYASWCLTKGADMQKTPKRLGTALFMTDSSNKDSSIHHVGWICGYAENGEPLVWEARGLNYGCEINQFSKRAWNRWGLMDKYFDYDKEPESIYPKQMTISTNKDPLNLRESAPNGSLIIKMPKGAQFFAQGEADGWAKGVYYDEADALYYEGWASLEYLK